MVNQGLALVLQRKGVVLDAQSRIRTAMKERLSEAARTNCERLSALQSRQSRLVLNRPKNLTPEAYRQQLATLQTKIQTIEQTLARDSAIVAKDLKQRTRASPCWTRKWSSRGWPWCSSAKEWSWMPNPGFARP